MEVFENSFIESVVDYYYNTIDESHPQGNMSAVAEQFSITRAKVNNLLITAEVIDSPLHQDIMKLKEMGYDNEYIALALGVSVTTVKIILPYEKAKGLAAIIERVRTIFSKFFQLFNIFKWF